MGTDNPGSGATLAWRECRVCGDRFMGGPRAWYCPECRKARRAETDRAHHIRKRMGASRALGSTDLCAVCGKPYTVEAGTQRYCKGCAPEAVKRIDNAQSREWNAANIVPEVKNAKRRIGEQERECRVCGKVFAAPSSRYAYCSDECRREGIRAIGRETGARRVEKRKAKNEKQPPP